MFLPAQKSIPQLSTQALDVVAMDAACIETSDEFEQQARRTILERESVGDGDRYSNIQPHSAPAIDTDFIGKRMDFCL